MNNSNPFFLLRGAKSEQELGLMMAKNNYIKLPTASHNMALGISYLWLRRYKEALEHFQRTIDSNPKCGDGIFGMAGVAKWCLGNPKAAVTYWNRGLSVKYARAGLAVRMSMLLFFASVLKPGIYERKLAEFLLLENTKDIRIKFWPGPIAKMLLGQIQLCDFELQIKGTDDIVNKNHFWLADFYKVIIQFDPNNLLNLKESMFRQADTTGTEWSDDRIFLNRIWSEEFFLARHEAEEIV